LIDRRKINSLAATSWNYAQSFRNGSSTALEAASEGTVEALRQLKKKKGYQSPRADH
jgi:hypothetical protein